ncbi:UNVERIFIED_CONTAM: hypothetical protein ABIC26_005280 [Paenibacillus sp. PvR008]
MSSASIVVVLDKINHPFKGNLLGYQLIKKRLLQSNDRIELPQCIIPSFGTKSYTFQFFTLDTFSDCLR